MICIYSIIKRQYYILQIHVSRKMNTKITAASVKEKETDTEYIEKGRGKWDLGKRKCKQIV
jgi:hypothetical protein